MKATLEFNLPEEKDEFENASKGLDYYCVLTDFAEKLRRFRKGSNTDNISFTDLVLTFNSSLNAYDVNLDK